MRSQSSKMLKTKCIAFFLVFSLIFALSPASILAEDAAAGKPVQPAQAAGAGVGAGAASAGSGATAALSPTVIAAGIMVTGTVLIVGGAVNAANASSTAHH